MYVTGGVGTTGNEGFGEAYSLPNISAYSETCAVLMFMTLNQRLFLATGDEQYIDVLERGIYNNAVDGVSLTGDRFFYVNRLASAGDGRDARWERASLECCPPNLVRFLAAMPGLRLRAGHAQRRRSTSTSMCRARRRFDVARRAAISLQVDSEMPWDGTIAHRRVPSTAHGRRERRRRSSCGCPGGHGTAGAGRRSIATSIDSMPRLTIAVNGTARQRSCRTSWATSRSIASGRKATPSRSSSRFSREGSSLTIGSLTRGAGSSIERGPIVYCAEWPDVDKGKALDLLVARDAPLRAAADKSAIGGARRDRHRGAARDQPAAAPARAR